MDIPTAPDTCPALATPAELHEGIARLSRGAYFGQTSLDMALSLLTESAARASRVERVSIWGFSGDQWELRCLEQFTLSRGRRAAGSIRHALRYPAYFAALREGNCIVADDALADPVTSVLAAEHLLPGNITAVLDTPIFFRGELQGLLSLEQVGAREPWHAAHRLFAHAVANLVALALVEHEAEQARSQAQKSAERLRSMSRVPLRAMAA